MAARDARVAGSPRRGAPLACLDDQLLGGATPPDTDALHGRYVRRYVEELRNVPDEDLREPWGMPDDLQREVGCVTGNDCPRPIVDHAEARRRALERYRV